MHSRRGKQESASSGSSPTVLRGVLTAFLLATLALAPVHAHESFSHADADEGCQLCVHASSGHVGHAPPIPRQSRAAPDVVSLAFSVAEAALPVRVCRGPPRH